MVTITDGSGQTASASCHIEVSVSLRLDAAAQAGCTVRGESGMILIDNVAIGEEIRIYMADGLLLSQIVACESFYRLPMAKDGVYIVVIGGKAYKIAVI